MQLKLPSPALGIRDLFHWRERRASLSALPRRGWRGAAAAAARGCSSSINRSGCTSSLVTCSLLTDAQLPPFLRYRKIFFSPPCILIHAAANKKKKTHEVYGERQQAGATGAAFSSKQPKGKKGEKPSSGIALLVMALHPGFGFRQSYNTSLPWMLGDG